MDINQTKYYVDFGNDIKTRVYHELKVNDIVFYIDNEGNDYEYTVTYRWFDVNNNNMIFNATCSDNPYIEEQKKK